MEIYIFLIIFLLFFSILGIKKNRKLLVFSFYFFWMMATFRDISIGNDTRSYYFLFKEVSVSSHFQNMIWRYEIGYLLLNKFISLFTSNFTIFLGIITAYMYNIYYRIIKIYSTNYIFSVFLFLTLGIWGRSINILRLELALIFVLGGYLLREKNKKYIGIFFSMLCVFFQRISIVFLLSFFIPKKINKKFYIVSLVFVVVLFLNFSTFLTIIIEIFPYFKIYLFESSIYSMNDFKLATIINITKEFLIFLFGIVSYLKTNSSLYSKSENKNFIYQVNMIYTAFLILIISLKFNLLDRCSYYFSVFEILMIPNALKRIEKRKRKIFTICILIFCSMYFFTIILMKPEWNRIVPYKTIL